MPYYCIYCGHNITVQQAYASDIFEKNVRESNPNGYPIVYTLLVIFVFTDMKSVTI